MDRETRNLGHHKANKIKSVDRPPYDTEGEDGDMRISKGVLYIKDIGVWYVFGYGRTASSANQVFTPTSLTDSTGTDVSTVDDFNTLASLGGTYSEGNTELAISNLGSKINEILTLIRKML